MAGFQGGECTPHFLWSCQRKRAVHGPKEKRFSSKLAPSGKFGDATVESHDRIKPARSHPGALKRSYQITLMPQPVSLPQIPGCLSKRPTFGPAAAPGDGFQRKGPQPLPSGRSGKGSRGKPSRKGFPLASLWGRPVSLGERNGSHLPTSIEVTPKKEERLPPGSPLFQNSPTWSGSTSPPMVRSCWTFSFHSRSAMAIFRMMFFTVWSRAVPSE